MRPPSFSMTFTPSSMALIVLSVVLSGAGGLTATFKGAVAGAAFGALTGGFAGVDLGATGAPGAGALAVVADSADFGAEDAGALGLEADVEVADFGTTPGPEAEGTVGLETDFAIAFATGVAAGVDPAPGLLVEVVDGSVVCFGVPTAGFPAGIAALVAGLLTVPDAGAGVDEAGFLTAGKVFGAAFAAGGLVAAGALFGAGEILAARAGGGIVGLSSAMFACCF